MRGRFNRRTVQQLQPGTGLGYAGGSATVWGAIHHAEDV